VGNDIPTRPGLLAEVCFCSETLIVVDMEARLCPFCCIAEANKPDGPCTGTVILSTPEVVVFLDIQPLISSVAHVLVVPRVHYGTLDQMAEDIRSAGALGVALAKLAKVLTEELGAEAFNVVQNNGTAAGQVVDHVHFHMVIRGKQWPQGENIKQLLTSQAVGVDFKTRWAYSSTVFCRGPRQDLDTEWASIVVPKLRTALSKL
jgi:diadenosine tetraphosphate (Ap4A) HIT family hydrolase